MNDQLPVQEVKRILTGEVASMIAAHGYVTWMGQTQAKTAADQQATADRLHTIEATLAAYRAVQRAVQPYDADATIDRAVLQAPLIDAALAAENPLQERGVNNAVETIAVRLRNIPVL